MEVTIHISEQLGLELLELPDRDAFVSQAVARALKERSVLRSPDPSGVANLSPDAARIMSLAGSWADMSEEEFASLTEELAERRRHAGSGRRRHEAGLD